jgi:hypothetical protein
VVKRELIIKYMGKSGVIFIAEEVEEDVIETVLPVAPKIESTEPFLPKSEPDEKLSQICLDLLATYKKMAVKPKVALMQHTVKAGEVLSPLAVLYERVRNVIDYKGSHLLRRNAIQRIVSRRLHEWPNADSKKTAARLVKELIWARYVENDTITEECLDKVATVLEKYGALFSASQVKNMQSLPEKNKFRDIILGTASSEIEELLDPSLFYIEAISTAMYKWFDGRFIWTGENISDAEKKLHLEIAIYKSLPKSDEARVCYHLLKKYVPGWEKMSAAEVSGQASELAATLINFNTYFTSATQAKLYRFVQKHTAAFQIIKEISEKDPENAVEIFENEVKLEKMVREVCAERYREIGRVVTTGIIRSKLTP